MKTKTSQHKLVYPILALTTAIASFVPITTTAQITPNHLQDLQAVASHLVGIMDTSAQAAVNPKRVSVRMITCQVQVDQEPDTIYLYQEQALSKRLDRPYRQRILKLSTTEDGQTESRSYKLQEVSRWMGLCQKNQEARQLQSADLGEAVCSVFLKPVISIYVGQTQPGGCPTNMRGAVKITNTIILHSQGMDTWDRGFDAEGKQVWGADNEGYQYLWVRP